MPENEENAKLKPLDFTEDGRTFANFGLRYNPDFPRKEAYKWLLVGLSADGDVLPLPKVLMQHYKETEEVAGWVLANICNVFLVGKTVEEVQEIFSTYGRGSVYV